MNFFCIQFHRKYSIILPLLVVLLHSAHTFCNQTTSTPKLTIIIVVDQFAYHYIRHITPYLCGGIKTMLEQGINYTNAYFPHATLSTATGHAGLSTGTFACQHGFIGNAWSDPQGKKTKCDDDHDPASTIVGCNKKKHQVGKSAINLMVDTISDQFVLQSTSLQPHKSFSISFKSRAAIATSGNLGKPLWFETNCFSFVSSKAYMQQLPEWIHEINDRCKKLLIDPYFWQSCYPLEHTAYATATQETYKFVAPGLPRINTAVQDVKVQAGNRFSGKKKNALILTPLANQMLLDVGLRCVQHEFANEHNNGRMLLWLCLSSFDKLGHFYGPNSFETLDMLYHLDNQLGAFMKQVEEVVGKNETLFVLTADHGVAPIPEIMQQKGYKKAHRIKTEACRSFLNQQINDTFGIQDLFTFYQSPQFFINNKKYAQLEKLQQDALDQYVTEYLESQNGVRQVFTQKQLTANYSTEEHTILLQRQMFPGRSGYFTLLLEPYCLDSNWSYGTDHRASYEYNTHVPLIVYWPKHLQAATITDRVWAIQLPATLATILNIPKPSACQLKELPGIFTNPSQQKMPSDLACGQENPQAAH